MNSSPAHLFNFQPENSILLVFDVESQGLHGAHFAVGWVVIKNGKEIEAGRWSTDRTFAHSHSLDDAKWVSNNVPAFKVTHTSARNLLHDFMEIMKRWKNEGASIWAECQWPVEARFLCAMVDDDRQGRNTVGPYPFHEIATAMAMAGMDPMAKYDRAPNELPVHDPLADARQSARLLCTALGYIAMLHRRPCPDCFGTGGITMGGSEPHTQWPEACPTCTDEPTPQITAPAPVHQSVRLELCNDPPPPADAPIHFYEIRCYWLSNFSSFGVTYEGFDYATSEHAYHAAKFGKFTMEFDRISKAPSAHEAMLLARKFKASQRADWDEVKRGIMKMICSLKLAQHEYIQRKLKATGTRPLVEVSPIDAYWGWGPNKDGRNELGKIWMELRDEQNARSYARVQPAESIEKEKPVAVARRETKVGLEYIAPGMSLDNDSAVYIEGTDRGAAIFIRCYKDETADSVERIAFFVNAKDTLQDVFQTLEMVQACIHNKMDPHYVKGTELFGDPKAIGRRVSLATPPSKTE